MVSPSLLQHALYPDSLHSILYLFFCRNKQYLYKILILSWRNCRTEVWRKTVFTWSEIVSEKKKKSPCPLPFHLFSVAGEDFINLTDNDIMQQRSVSAAGTWSLLVAYIILLTQQLSVTYSFYGSNFIQNKKGYIHNANFIS